MKKSGQLVREAMTGLANSWLLLEAPEAETGLPWAGELRLPIRRPRKVRPPESTNADEHCMAFPPESRFALQVVEARYQKLTLFGFRARANPGVRLDLPVSLRSVRCLLGPGGEYSQSPPQSFNTFRPFCCAGSARVAFVSRRQTARVRNLLKSRQELSSDCLRRLPIVLGAQKFDRNPLPPED